MRYITSVERIGIKKGIEKGIQKGLEQGLHNGWSWAILDTLQVRFKRVPQNVRQLLEKVNSNEQLKTLHRKALTVDTVSEFIGFLEAANDDVH